MCTRTIYSWSDQVGYGGGGGGELLASSSGILLHGIFIPPKTKACPLDDVSRSSITVSAIAGVFYVSGVAVIFDFVSVGVGGGSDICLDLPAFPKSVQ